MNYKPFYDLIVVADKDKPKANHFLNRRGLEEHIRIANFLALNSSKPISYAEVATVLRYDKRIRRILYKYIGYIEELIRAFISNRYPHINSLPPKCREKISNEAFSRATIKTSTFEVISYDLFNNLMQMSQSLTIKQQKLLFPCLIHKDEENFDALNRLRDQIGHNKILINNRDLLDVILNGEITGSILKRNIMNLLNFLPKNLHRQFINEINTADLDKGELKSYQTDWILPPFLVIKIKD